MELHELTRIKATGKRRFGQGHGSGRVKTSGRGTKGQNARNKVPAFFEGGALPLIKRMPFRRGNGRNKSFKRKEIAINVEKLTVFPAKAKIDVDALIKQHIVLAKDVSGHGVKLIGNAKLEKAYTVLLPLTKGAKQSIENAGGSVGVIPGETN